MNAGAVRAELKHLTNPRKAKILKRFFKTGKGEYAEGDMFLGITVPQSRKIAQTYRDIPWKALHALIKSPYHEERLVALLILVERFQKLNEVEKEKIYRFYLSHTKYINNWDLVDLSAEKIVGAYLEKKSRAPLVRLAKSKSLWERRIAIIATFYFIKKDNANETFRIAKILLKDRHNLIQKAVGWMLREIGKRVSREKEEEFLMQHLNSLSRTTLRYAIEHFPEPKRKRYLKENIR